MINPLMYSSLTAFKLQLLFPLEQNPYAGTLPFVYDLKFADDGYITI